MLFFILIFCNLVLTQEPCEGTCLSEEQTIEVFDGLKECEFNENKNNEKINLLNEQVLLLEQKSLNDSLIIKQYEYQLKLNNDLIKLVKPKWYENKYLWFFAGFCTMYISTEAASNIGN